MKKVLLLMAFMALASVASANLLVNGDFEAGTSDDNGFDGSGWTHWSWGNGWSNREVKYNDETNGFQGGNGTWLLNVGDTSWGGGGGAYQVLAATEGTTFQLTVESGADKWWLPTGYMSLIWLDSTDTEIGNDSRTTVDPANYGGVYDAEHPMESYTLVGTAPAGTASVKVEFSANNIEGGSVTFDNAVLEVVPEPATLVLLGLGGFLFRSRR